MKLELYHHTSPKSSVYIGCIELEDGIAVPNTPMVADMMDSIDLYNKTERRLMRPDDGEAYLDAFLKFGTSTYLRGKIVE
jgi:hypothetical protein